MKCLLEGGCHPDNRNEIFRAGSHLTFLIPTTDEIIKIWVAA